MDARIVHIWSQYDANCIDCAISRVKWMGASSLWGIGDAVCLDHGELHQGNHHSCYSYYSRSRKIIHGLNIVHITVPLPAHNSNYYWIRRNYAMQTRNVRNKHKFEFNFLYMDIVALSLYVLLMSSCFFISCTTLRSPQSLLSQRHCVSSYLGWLEAFSEKCCRFLRKMLYFDGFVITTSYFMDGFPLKSLFLLSFGMKETGNCVFFSHSPMPFYWQRT